MSAYASKKSWEYGLRNFTTNSNQSSISLRIHQNLTTALAVGLCEDQWPENRFVGNFIVKTTAYFLLMYFISFLHILLITKFLKNNSLTWIKIFSEADFQFFAIYWGFTSFERNRKNEMYLRKLYEKNLIKLIQGHLGQKFRKVHYVTNKTE